MRRRAFAALLGGLVVVAACGSTARREAVLDAAGDPRGATSPVAEVAATAPGATVDGVESSVTTPSGRGAGAAAPSAAGGATRDPAPTGPIEVGFLTTAVSNAAVFGASTGSRVTERDMLAALARALNQQGGLAGRRMVPVLSSTDTASADWEADYAAACASFTEDHHVSAVLGYSLTHSDSFETCLARKDIPHLISATAADAATMRSYPLYFALTTPAFEQRFQGVIGGSLAGGLLGPTNRLGVVVDGCPGSKRAWSDTLRPYLQSQHVTVPVVYELVCTRGAADLSTQAGGIANLVLQLRSGKVDRVMFFGSEGILLYAVANASETQGYRPTYLLSSATLAQVETQIPPGQRANVHGFGWIPTSDVQAAQLPPAGPAAVRCLALLKHGGVVPTAPIDVLAAFNACDAVFLYDEALRITGGRTDGPLVAAAIEGMGAAHQSAVTIGGTRFSPTRHAGPVSALRYDWRTACQCFAYGTQTVAFR